MNITIRLFGQLTDITGADTLSLQGAVDTDALVTILEKNYPALVNSRYIIAVDKKVISANTPLTEHSTVALLPPFSGG